MDDKTKRTLPPLNRRQFLQYSGTGTAIGMSSVLLPSLSFANLNNSVTSANNVWVNETAPNQQDNYYRKFKQLMASIKDNPINHENSSVIVTLDLREGRSHPFSTDPQLVYSTIKYLVEEAKIDPLQISLTNRTPLSKSQAIKLIQQNGIQLAIRQASPKTNNRSLRQLNKMAFQWDVEGKKDTLNIRLPSNNNQYIHGPIHESNGKSSLTIKSFTRVVKDNRVHHPMPGSIIASTQNDSCELLGSLLNESFSAQSTPMEKYTKKLEWNNHQAGQPMGISNQLTEYAKKHGIDIVASTFV